MMSGNKINFGKRKIISLSQDALVNERQLRPGSPMPLLIEPAVDGVNVVEWTRNNRELIKSKLRTHGALLFRGFAVNTVQVFEEFMTALSDELLDYSYRSTPRTLVSGKIYTSTEYPAHQTIPLHNEMAYSRSWPMLIGFFCVVPAGEGGETPIADSRKVFQRISPAIRDRFMQKNVMYVRNYGDVLDLPWQDVFQTNDRAAVEKFCGEAGIEFEWRGQNELRTWQVCQSAAKHPVTGEMVWFNQAHLFHVSALSTEISSSLNVDGREPPRNALYGDGLPIDDSHLAEIRAAYDKEVVVFPWERQDVLLLDNMLAAHGRKPFRGERKVVVGMAEAFGSGEAI